MQGQAIHKVIQHEEKFTHLVLYAMHTMVQTLSAWIFPFEIVCVVNLIGKTIVQIIV